MDESFFEIPTHRHHPQFHRFILAHRQVYRPKDPAREEAGKLFDDKRKARLI